MVQKIYAFTTGATTFTVPADWNNASNQIIVIGGGGGGGRPPANSGGAGGGGGGGWAERSNTTLTPGSAVTISVGAGGTGASVNGTTGGTGGQTWIRIDGGAVAPTTSAQGLLAAGGLGGGGLAGTRTGGIGGGANVANIGVTIVTGSTGGAGSTTAGTGGGGGGISRINSQTGGGVFVGAPGGGGGGAGQTQSGNASTSSIGGTGGTGYLGSAGGTGGNAAAGGTGSSESGGGGGAGRSNSTAGFNGGTGGPGSRYIVTNTTGAAGAIAASTAIGPGGGGGGGGGNTTANSNGGIGGSCNGNAAYGGGGGGGGGGVLNGGTGGTGGLGIIIIIYNTPELYWIGGSGTWDNANTANWSWTSGGTTAGTVPSATIDATFDANSDAGAGYTVTIGTSAACKNFTFSAPDQTVTLAGSTNLSIAGSMTLTASRLAIGTYTGSFNFTATTTGFTVNTAGNTINSIGFTGTGGGWTLSGAVTCNGTFSHTAGTLALNNQAVTCSIFSITSSTTRTLNYGTTSTVTITGNNGTIIDGSTLTGLTVSGTIPTHTLNYSGSVGTRTISYASTAAGTVTTYPPIAITAGTDSIIFTTSSRIGSLNFTGFSGTWNNAAFSLFGSLTVSSGMTVGAGANTLTFAHTTGTATINSAGKTFDFPVTQSGTTATTVALGANLTLGSTRTYSQTIGTLNISTFVLSTGIFTTNASTTRNITFGAGGYIQITGNSTTVWDGNNATNLTITGTSRVDLTYAGSVGTRIINHGFSGPTAANSPNFNVTAGSDTISIATNSRVSNLNFTGFSGTWTNDTLFMFGNLTTPAVMTVGAGTGVLSFVNTTGTATITSNGELFDFPVTQNGSGGTLTIADNLTLGSTRTFTHTAGTFNISTFVLSTGIFNTNGSLTRNLTFGAGGYIILTNSGVAVWDGATVTGLTITGTSRVDLTYAGSVGTRTITHGSTAGGAITNTINFNLTAGTDGFTITASSWVGSLNTTGFSGTWTMTAYSTTGSMTVSSTLAINSSSTNGPTFVNTSGTATIISNGKTFAFPVTINGSGGTVALGDNLTMSIVGPTLTTGTLSLGSFILNAPVFNSNGSGTRNINFSSGGYIVIPANNATIWNCTNVLNLTITGTSRVDLTYAGSVGTRTINNGGSGGATPINFNITAGSDIITATYHLGTMNFTGFSGTWTNSATYIYGDLITPTTMTIQAGTNALTWLNTTTATITSNGMTYDFPITITTNTAATLALNGNLNMGTTRNLTHNSGTLSLGTFAFTFGTYQTSSISTRSIDFGASGYLRIAGNAAAVWLMLDTSGFSVTGTPRVDFVYSGGTGSRTITHGTNSGIAARAIDVNITAGTDTIVISASGNSSFVRNLNFTGFSGTLNGTNSLTVYGDLTFSPTMTLASTTASLTLLGTTNSTVITNGILVNYNMVVNCGTTTSKILGDDFTQTGTPTFTLTQGTLDLNDFTLTLTGGFVSSVGNTRSISTGPGGGGTIVSNATGTIWNVSTATAFTISGGVQILQLTVPLNTATARSILHGDTAGGTESNALKVKVQAGTGQFTLTGFFGDINLSGFTGTITNNTRTIYGDLILDPGTIIASAASITTFAKSTGAQFVTTNGAVFGVPVTKTGAGTVYLSDNFTGGTNTALTLSQGRIDLTNVTLTVTTVTISGTLARGFDIGTTGQINLTGSGTAWNLASITNFTMTGTGTINAQSSTATTFAGAGYTGYPRLNMGGTGGLTITGANTFTALSNTVNATLTLPSATTTTVGSFLVQGVPTNRVLLRSSTAGSQATLSDASGTVNAYYIDIRDSNATGGASWNYDTLTGINSGNNTGWNFIALPLLPAPGRFMTFFYGI